MRHWDGKQRKFQQKNTSSRPSRSAAVPSGAEFVAVSASPSPSSPLSVRAHHSPSVFRAFTKTTPKTDKMQNEQVAITRNVPPMTNKDCVSMSPSSSRPNVVVGHRSAAAVSFVPKTPCRSPSSPCQPEFCFELPSTSLSFVSSSPVPSPKWNSTQQNFTASTLPKSAMLMSKCQSFLKGSSVLIPSTPSTVLAKHQKDNNDSIDRQQITEKGGNNDECVFNFEGLFETMNDDRSEKPFGGKEESEMEVENVKAKSGPEKTVKTNEEKAEGGPNEAVAESACSLQFLRSNENMEVNFDWPLCSLEHCTIQIGTQGMKDVTTMPILDEHEHKCGEGLETGEEVAIKQTHQPKDVRRATRLHHRRGRPSPLTPIGAVISLFDPPDTGRCSHCPSTSTTSPPIPSNAIYSIRIGSIQLRNVPALSVASRESDVQVVVAIRLDKREVFRSCPVHLSGNCCVISEEFCMELPRSSIFNSLQLSLFELTEGARIQRCIGRLRLTRDELIAYGNAIQNRWLPIARIRPSELTETLGSLCAELSWNGQQKMLTLRVFDFTIWTLPANNGRLNPLQRHCNEGGRLYLKCRLGVDYCAFSTMQKMRLVERRCVEPVRFDCSNLFVDQRGQHRPSPSPQQQEGSPLEEEWLSCRSLCVTPTSAFSVKEHFRFNSRQFKFPPPSSPALCHQQQNKEQKTPKGQMLTGGEPHLYIKLYGKPNYSEDSFCGFVHMPLEIETMKPKDTPHGPNWFNIHSRAKTTILNQFSTFVTNNSAFSSSTSNQLTTSELNSTPLPPFHHQKQSQTRQQHFPCSSDFSHHRRLSGTPSNSSPSLHRNCSLASTSELLASTVTKSGSVSNSSTVANTRLKLLTAPYITPFSLSGANEPDNASPLQSRKIKHHQQQRHLDAAKLPFSSGSLSASNSQQSSGEVRLKLWYDMDQMHPFVNYRPLYFNLVRSLNVDPHACSLISLIQCLPVDLENLAKPLMKIFVHSSQIRQFFRAICMDYVKSCNDVNTLFRSQSLASKVMYEMMKFVGQNYLSTSLKPLIDLIFAERKCCEIDPSKLKPGDSLEQNFRNITTYAELAFDQVVHSLSHCPYALRELFAELRGVVEQIYPNRHDVARLAVSSFLIMRFFAAAILNPKLFALKLETPDVEVSRTLVLVSKILQRISNCVVSAHPLTNKEHWLTPVLQRFSDRDKIAMIQFLDKVSQNDTDERCQPSEINFMNNENISPVSSSCYETAILKSGYLIERRCRPIKKRSLKNLIHPKRRFVILTDSSLIWHKSAKDGTATSTSLLMSTSLTMGSEFNANAEQQKSQIALSDVTSVSVLSDAKNAFRVTTMNTEVHFQANSETELNEWTILIQKQQRRQLMVKDQAVLNSQAQQQMCAEIDLERELHIVYTNLESHMDTLCDHNWCCRFECARCFREDLQKGLTG